jgi:transposase InsO family protein
MVARRLRSKDVLEALGELFLKRGIPAHLRSDNGSEFVAGELRDELLNLEIFDTLKEAQMLSEWWRKSYNTVRPHSSLGLRPPAPEAQHPRPPNTGPDAGRLEELTSIKS